MMRLMAGALGLVFLNGCATGQSRTGRLLSSVVVGVATGAAGGALLSPNRESRGLNALVFGLGGGLASGALAVLSSPSGDEPRGQESLKERELGNASNSSQEFQLPVDASLPQFVRQRLRPAIIEEYTEADSIAEDGSLRAPHKVYRIKRPAELIARPKGVSDER